MANNQDREAQLTLRHVPFLVEHLSGNASLWRHLGTALLFQKGDLDNIQACQPLISTSPYSFMQRLVEEWLEGKYPHTAPSTLANLLKALNSHTVGLGTLATQVRDSLTQHELSIHAKVFEIASISDQGDITFKQYEDIKVNENECICLKVKINSKAQKCKWNSTGLDDKHKYYSDIKTPFLSISKADIDMDGSKYSCAIIYNNHKTDEGELQRYEGTTETTPVTLRVSCPPLDQFKESLASIYLAQPEVPQDSWPPTSNKKYINLALVKQQALNYGGKYAHLTIRGDIDDDLHHKEKIEYKNILNGLRSGSLLLIEGRPGSGKTTFVYKITRDWATSVQGPMRLVLLVSLRVLNSWQKSATLEDILQLFDLQKIQETLKERKGKGVCIIFDGLDEFSPLEGENSLVSKIINKTYLPQSIVIVASRPAAFVKLRQRADKVIEVVGFTKDQIFEYVENYPFSDTSKVDQLKSYLLSHPNVLHMCYLPIHAAMIAFLFEVMGKVPRTETEIYKHFTRFTIIRSLSKHKQNELEHMDINNLSEEEKKLFGNICKFALEKTILQKQVLDQDEMKLHLQGKDRKDTTLGLITVDRTAGLYGFKNIYTYHHLTYQEYLAAHHISTLSDEDQHKLIKQCGDTDHMQIVWKFYCGLVNFEGQEYKIKALINKRNKMGLYDIQCVYESQQDMVCNCFMKEMDAKIILEDKYLTTTDFIALGYLLANTSEFVSLSLIKCDLSVESANTLLAEIGGKLLSLRALHCKSNKIDLAALVLLLRNSSGPVSLTLIKCNINNEAVNAMMNEKLFCLHVLESHDINLESLTKLLSQQYNLECLKISYSSHINLDDSGFSDIIRSTLENVKELSLTNVRVGPKTLSSLLEFCQELTYLTLNSTAEAYDIEPLLTGVPKSKNLETMSYSISNSFSGLCSVVITANFNNAKLPNIYENISMVNSNKFLHYVQGVTGNYLQTLRLESENTVICDIKPYSRYWPPGPRLFALHQPPCRVHCVIPTMTECVSDFSALEKLILINIEIIQYDARLLADILCKCVLLEELDLGISNLIRTPDTIKTILTGLKNCSKLKKLSLNNAKTDTVCVLASYLQHWPQLQELYLRDRCSIEEKGHKAIADNIKYCPELTKMVLGGNKTSKMKFMLQPHTDSSLSSHRETSESSLPLNFMSSFQSYETSCCTQ